MSSYEDQIKQMYGANLTSQKEQLKSDYEAADQALTLQKEENQKITDSNLRQTRIDAQKSAVNNEEYYAASGLTSGAKAQARLAQDNQLLSNLTTIRTAQQEADALIERQRATLAKEYESAITKAQADNDLALAKDLYEQAQKEDAQLLAKQEAAAKLMAEGGDYSLLGQMYGLSNWQTMRLSGGSAETLKTLDALHANNISETDRDAVLNTVQSVYDQMRAGGATQTELDNYLIGLHTAGILQKAERVDIHTGTTTSGTGTTGATGATGTTTTGTTSATKTMGTDDDAVELKVAYLQRDVGKLRNVYEDWYNLLIDPTSNDANQKSRLRNYELEYGSIQELKNLIAQKETAIFAIPGKAYAVKPVFSSEDVDAYAAAWAKEKNLAIPDFTEQVKSFFNTVPTKSQALSRGISEDGWKSMIRDKINHMNLSENEITAIIMHYGLYE